MERQACNISAVEFFFFFSFWFLYTAYAALVWSRILTWFVRRKCSWCRTKWSVAWFNMTQQSCSASVHCSRLNLIVLPHISAQSSSFNGFQVIFTHCCGFMDWYCLLGCPPPSPRPHYNDAIMLHAVPFGSHLAGLKTETVQSVDTTLETSSLASIILEMTISTVSGIFICKRVGCRVTLDLAVKWSDSHRWWSAMHVLNEWLHYRPASGNTKNSRM
jgi:hypothetical protein